MPASSRNSLLCPRCRKLVSGDEKICPYCGLTNPAGRKLMKLLNHLSMGRLDLIPLIIYVNTGLLFLALLLDPGSLSLALNPFTFLSPSNETLFYLGASGAIPIFGYGRLWTIISASFLHGSLLHIFFNMTALWQLGPFVLREYGSSRFLLIYILAGAVGFLLSSFMGVALTIGASASICALIGAIIYYGKSRGDLYGHLIYRQALGWVVGLALIGLIVPGINNWAHGGGLVAGILLAWLLGYQEVGHGRTALAMAGWLCAVMTLAILFWSIIQAIFIFFAI